MTYTPGPWKVCTNNYGLEICTIHCVTPQVAEDGHIQSWVHVGVGEFHVPSESEQLANAKLIAAAPELFEALTLVMSWVKNWDPNFTEDDEWLEDERKIEAAIAKAS